MSPPETAKKIAGIDVRRIGRSVHPAKIELADFVDEAGVVAALVERVFQLLITDRQGETLLYELVEKRL